MSAAESLELAKARRDRDEAQILATEAMRLMTPAQMLELRRILGGQASGEELTCVNPVPTMVA
jgi:hypothetical protein